MKSTMFLTSVLLGLLYCLHGVDSSQFRGCGAWKVRAGGCLRYREVRERIHRGVTVQKCGDLCGDLEKCVSFVYQPKKRTCYILNGKCPVGYQKTRFSYHEFERCSCAKSNRCVSSGGTCVQMSKYQIACVYGETKTTTRPQPDHKKQTTTTKATTETTTEPSQASVCATKVYDGGCAEASTLHLIMLSGSYTPESCTEKCLEKPACKSFGIDVSGPYKGSCVLFRGECTNDDNKEWVQYSVAGCRKAKTCTGTFYEKGSKAGNGKARPPAGTVCTSKCFHQKGRWGASYCHVAGGSNWGAPCVQC